MVLLDYSSSGKIEYPVVILDVECLLACYVMGVLVLLIMQLSYYLDLRLVYCSRLLVHNRSGDYGWV